MQVQQQAGPMGSGAAVGEQAESATKSTGNNCEARIPFLGQDFNECGYLQEVHIRSSAAAQVPVKRNKTLDNNRTNGRLLKPTHTCRNNSRVARGLRDGCGHHGEVLNVFTCTCQQHMLIRHGDAWANVQMQERSCKAEINIRMLLGR